MVYVGHVSEVRDFWNSRRPPIVPREWTDNFAEDEEDDDEWSNYFGGHICDFPASSLDIQLGGHYYGRPVPLLRFQCNDTVIVDIGGLLFLWTREISPQGLIALQPHLTLLEVADVVTSDDDSSITLGLVELVQAQLVCLDAFHGTWGVEFLRFGRNRWGESAERGGRVNEEYLDKEKAWKRLYS